MVTRRAIEVWTGKTGILRAADALRRGGLVAFPTETVYGLGADARNPAAVAGIFAAKQRPTFNPLITHVASQEQARAFGHFNAKATQLANAFWPGPLTLVLPLKQDTGIADLVTAGLTAIGLRVPAHPVAQALLSEFGGPIAAPSANPSGKVSPTTAEHVLAGLDGQIAGVLDAGPCAIGLESTIIGFDRDAAVLLRPGGIPAEVLEACLGAPLAAWKGSAITAPGQIASHYAPGVSLRLDAKAPRPGEAWIGFGKGEFPVPSLNLSPSGDLSEAAAGLFSALRRIDDLAKGAGLSAAAVAVIPETGLGRAINDRLRRAAAPRPDPDSGPPAGR